MPPCKRAASLLLLALLLGPSRLRPCEAASASMQQPPVNLDGYVWSYRGWMATCASQVWSEWTFLPAAAFAAFCRCHATQLARFSRQTLTMRGYISNMMQCGRDSTVIGVGMVMADIMQCFGRLTGHVAR